MTAIVSSVLKVPGAQLYFERRGQGPVVLLIPGGPQDAGVFEDLARHLSSHFTVVSFDPRANSRSLVDGPPGDLSVDDHSDDALAVLRACSSNPVHVFGTSGGAHIALNLAKRHRDWVDCVVAHEPPSIMLLHDPKPAIAEEQKLHQLYRSEGIEAAMAEFFSANGFNSTDKEAGPEQPNLVAPQLAETFGRVAGNFGYWLEHGMLPLAFYCPDVDFLKTSGVRVSVAIGLASMGQPIEAMGRALADALGVEPILVPGDHGGFQSHAREFADLLGVLFTSRRNIPPSHPAMRDHGHGERDS